MSFDCLRVDPASRPMCAAVATNIQEFDDKLDSLQTQIYIIAGVGGGVALILIIVVISLAVQLSSIRKQTNAYASKIRGAANNPKKQSKSFDDRGQSDYPLQQQQHQSSPPSQSYIQQPPKPPSASASAEEELAQLGFSAYTGHSADQRGFSDAPSPVINSSGGVRVLPRNPPPGFRQNAGFNQNERYM